MAPEFDPYRTLGLARGAPLAEVKRAYRRLAKANHPDAAGEAALPRFLAIQAAYDQIAGPDAGASAAGGRTGSKQRPWDAQPDRAEATHRAYGGRSRRTRPSGPRPTPGADDPPRPPKAPRAPRPPKLATMGSTSYDGVDSEPFEPDWGGASWYGTTSGTYWTLNPREYADPRKHGPEYQARARRAAEAASETADTVVEAADTVAEVAAEQAEAAAEQAEPAEPKVEGDRPAPPTHTTSSWWDATAGARSVPDPPAPAAGHASADSPLDPAWPTAAPMPPNGIADASASVWEAARWLETGAGGVVGRVIRAVVGWAPVALGIGWLAGEVTGCARFSATCDASSAPIAWFAQLVILALLLIVSRLAAAACLATIGTVAAAIPGSLLLTSMGGAADLTSGRAALGGLLVIGWLVGLVVGIWREIREIRAVGPVS